MKPSKKAGIMALFVLGMSIFGYSQYVSASQIGVSISQSELLNEGTEGSDYNVELQFENPSLLILTAGETEFLVLSDDEVIGQGTLEPFTLSPLDNSNTKGTFHTERNSDDTLGSVKISGVIKYDIWITSLDVPFVYYPTDEQAREFIH